MRLYSVANFKFRLEFLRKYRKDVLTKAQKESSALNSELLLSKNRLSECVKQREEMLTYISKNPHEIGLVKLFSEIVKTETVKMTLINAEIEKVSKEVERHRKWVEHLHRELKVVENLKEKQKEIFDFEEKKRERKQIDGWVVERWKRS